MDKNTLVGFALIGVVIVGFGIWNRPSQEEMERARHYQDSIQAVAQKQEEIRKAQDFCSVFCNTRNRTVNYTGKRSGTAHSYK